ncbi:MAG: methylmalonyl-CoA epimerase [Planctomycetota bacterium]
MHPLPPALAGLVKGLHHVAIVVPSVAEAAKAYVGVLGFQTHPLEYVADQKVNVLVCFAGKQRIELVEPAAPDSPVTNFLAKRGPGLHHLAYEVEDVAAALEAVKKAGLRVIDQSPRPGAHGTKIAFLHPSAMHGVLTELVEEPSEEDWSE